MSKPKRTVRSCHVGQSARPHESLDKAKPLAVVRWDDGETEELSEHELGELIDRYRRSGQEIPEKLQEGLRQFELYPTSLREVPIKTTAG